MFSEPIGISGPVSSPFANIRAFTLLLFMLMAVEFCMEASINQGPVGLAIWKAAVPHIEQEWGFTAEYRRTAENGTALVVTSVEPGGPFARAGIEPGNTVTAPGRNCFGHRFRLYEYLDEGASETKVYVYRDLVRFPFEEPTRVEVSRDERPNSRFEQSPLHGAAQVAR